MPDLPYRVSMSVATVAELHDFSGIAVYEGNIDFTLAALRCLVPGEGLMPGENPLGTDRPVVFSPDIEPLQITTSFAFGEVVGPPEDWFSRVDELFLEHPTAHAWARTREELLELQTRQLPIFRAKMESFGYDDPLTALRSVDLSNCLVFAERVRQFYLAVLEEDRENTVPWWTILREATLLRMREDLESHEDGGGCALLTYLYAVRIMELSIPVLEASL